MATLMPWLAALQASPALQGLASNGAYSSFPGPSGRLLLGFIEHGWHQADEQKSHYGINICLKFARGPVILNALLFLSLPGPPAKVGW